MRDDTRQILRLAVPATIENILQALVGFIDTLMIAQLGLFAVTGVGLGNNTVSYTHLDVYKRQEYVHLPHRFFCR